MWKKFLTIFLITVVLAVTTTLFACRKTEQWANPHEKYMILELPDTIQANNTGTVQ